MEEKQVNWTEFRRKIFIDGSVEKLYRCWATSGEMATWFLRKCENTSKDGVKRESGDLCEKGDTYVWAWHNWDIEEGGTVLEANGKDSITYSFAGEGRVTVNLSWRDDRQMTLLELTQTNIPLDEQSKMNIHVGCSNGWTFWMANLKAYVEHGVLLNDKNLDPSDMTVGHEFVNS